MHHFATVQASPHSHRLSASRALSPPPPPSPRRRNPTAAAHLLQPRPGAPLPSPATPSLAGATAQKDLSAVSRRNEDGDIISSKTKDALLSYAQTLEKHSGTLEYHTIKDARKIKQLSLRELELEDAAREAHYEHELEVKDFLERIEKLKTRVAYLEEELDMGENLHPEGDIAP
ncbi:hypothetical protein ZWY2020_021285 [Hordeum vulgare]|nr:hypothetical protein ZWY2020_021285 [Hordeum vulgare]